mmetsp:Transcript_60312/g.166947  ORF Transcript_60312/g.166947 Transcript_60312/m.166947 type:complete len:201 (-) Transcript_60312:32-634(-)
MPAEIGKLATTLEDRRLHTALLILQPSKLSSQLRKVRNNDGLFSGTSCELRTEQTERCIPRLKLCAAALLLSLCRRQAFRESHILTLSAQDLGPSIAQRELHAGPLQALPLAGQACPGLADGPQFLLEALAPLGELARLLREAAALRRGLCRGCRNEAPKPVRKDPCGLQCQGFGGSTVKRHPPCGARARALSPRACCSS